MLGPRTYVLTALTDIWTGDASGKGERLITTGLLGSIRWWFEVVVRGLGGSACDPTLDGNRCPDSHEQPTEAGHHCVVCELFGCTGWARKFRFAVLDAAGQPQQKRIRAQNKFQLWFTPLRPIADEEWALLESTIRLIAEYGAIGGKTVFKPSDEKRRQKAFHHQDFGLIKLNENPLVTPVNSQQLLRQYVDDLRWRRVDHDDFAWASLRHFWCVKGCYLARQDPGTSSFNRVVNRPEPKTQSHRNDSWLAGRRPSHGASPESKKVFSFKDPPRTFGFVQSANELDAMEQRLKEKAWKDLKDDKFVTGAEILRKLLG